MFEQGFYIVKGEINISGRIICNGVVNIILMENATLNANEGITVEQSYSVAGVPAALNVYATKDGSGTLKASVNKVNAAPIGTVSTTNACGKITIGWGKVIADGTPKGGYDSDSYLFPGIGGMGAEITINGGEVYAAGGSQAAGIGSPSDNNKDLRIVINGGKVTAIGGAYGAGIGDGYNTPDVCTIEINGGVVNATGGLAASGIGDGQSFDGEEFPGKTIFRMSKGTLTAKPGEDDPDEALENHYYSIRCSVDQSFISDELVVYAGANEEEAKKTPYYAGRIDVCSVNRYVYIAYPGSDKDDGTEPEEEDPNIFKYVNSEGNVVTLVATEDEPLPIWYLTSNASRYVENQWPPKVKDQDGKEISLTGKLLVVKGTVTYESRIHVKGDVSLVLCDGAVLNAKAGITVPKGSSLTIFGQYNQTGRLIATGPAVHDTAMTKYRAAIGADSSVEGGFGRIAIYGGIIEATAKGGAGIGGTPEGELVETSMDANPDSGNQGYHKVPLLGGSGGEIIIGGGTVVAKGGSDSAGIGDSFNVDNSGTRIVITGGRVSANGAQYAAGIGSGQNSTGCDITITGGEVVATAGYGGAGIGTGYKVSSRGNLTPVKNLTEFKMYGGSVRATASWEGAGVGGGLLFNGGNIRIFGGTLYAEGGATGIGGGSYANGGSFKIEQTVDGTVQAAGHRFAIEPTVTVTAYSTKGGEAIGHGPNGTDSGTIDMKGFRVLSGADAVSAEWVVVADGKDMRLEACRQPYAYLEYCVHSGIAYLYDEFNHHQACPHCGISYDKNPHTFGAYEGNEFTHTRTCTVCGYAETTKHEFHEQADGRVKCRFCAFTKEAVHYRGIVEAKQYTTYKYKILEFEPGDDVVLDAADPDSFGGWFVIRGTLTAEKRIEVLGDVKLILCDGASLTAKNGIHVTDAGRQISKLTIYAQGTAKQPGTGTLTATVPANVAGCAAIGGNAGESAGEIRIYGGVITAEVEQSNISWQGAGIGSGANPGGVSTPSAPSASSLIAIYRGTIRAVGGRGAAGIGGGYCYSGGNIVIDGHTVYAEGCRGAGIGGGYLGAGGNITITGGAIEARGTQGGAGIGGGYGNNAGTILFGDKKLVNDAGEIIETAYGDAVVTAIGSGGAGVGAGQYGEDGKITILRGTLRAEGTAGGAGIGSGSEGAAAFDVLGSRYAQALRVSELTVSLQGGNVTALSDTGAGAGYGANAYGGGTARFSLTIGWELLTDRYYVSSYTYKAGGSYKLTKAMRSLEHPADRFGATGSAGNFVQNGQFNGTLIPGELMVVSYDANTGEGTVPNEAFTKGTVYTLPQWKDQYLPPQYSSINLESVWSVTTGSVNSLMNPRQTVTVNSDVFVKPNWYSDWRKFQKQIESTRKSGKTSLENRLSLTSLVAILDDGPITIPEGLTVELHMAIGSILKSNGRAGEYAIIVEKGGTLKLVDEYPDEGSAVSGFGGGGILVQGTLVTENVTIRDSAGGGVRVASGGRFEMNGGSIVNNTLSSSAAGGAGVTVEKGGSFTMNSGTITGNTAEKGAGVYAAGTFSVSGNVNITGNRGKDLPDADSDVLLERTSINVTGELAKESRIGVRSLPVPTEGNPVVITSGLRSKGLAEGVSNFFPNAYLIGILEDGEAILGAPVTVSFDANRAGGSMDSITVPSGGLYTLPDVSAFTLREHTVVDERGAWKVSDKAGRTDVVMQPGDAITISTDTVLKFNWISRWNLLQRMIDEADGEFVFKLTGDLVPADAEEALRIPEDKSVSIDLNGYSIDRRLTSLQANGNVITVYGALVLSDSSRMQTGKVTGGFNGLPEDMGNEDIQPNGGGIAVLGATASLTIEGGSITGNIAGTIDGTAVRKDLGCGGGVYVQGGSLIMKGGSISKNRSQTDGGGVYLSPYSSFSLEGGSIDGNTVICAGSGGGICANIRSDIAIFGGSITGNAVPEGFGGGGISLPQHTSLKLSGSPLIIDNRCVAADNSPATPCNVTVYADTAAFVIAGELSAFARIGVSAAEVYADRPTVLTQGLKGSGNAWVFVSDNEYAIGTNADGEAVVGIGIPVRFAADTEYAGGSMADATAVSGTPFTLPECGFKVPENAEFAGWRIGDGEELKDAGESVVFNADITPELTLTAVFESAFDRLQREINAAAAGSVITLTEEVKAAPFNSALEFPKGKKLTIDLNGHSIDRCMKSAQAGGNVINIAGNLTVKDSSAAASGRITGGWSAAGENGGGVRLVSGSRLTMEGGSISGNRAEGYGGGAAITGGTLILQGGSITGNTANGAGGGVYAQGGGVNMINGAILDNRVLDPGNTASYQGGGGVFLTNNAGLTMRAGEIGGNTTKIGSGGGVYARSSGCAFYFYGGVVRGNTAEAGSGGGVMIGSGGYLYMEKNAAVTANTAGKDGGGVYFAGRVFDMENSTITGNTATDGRGGGVFLYSSDIKSFYVEADVQITGNTASGRTENVTFNNDSQRICLDGKLSEDSRIGVSAVVPSGIAGSVVVTRDLKGNGTEKNFVYDNTDDRYCLGIDAYGELILGNAIQVSFEKNHSGASGTMADARAAVGTFYTLPECGFTAPFGMRFAGWEPLSINAGWEPKQPGETLEIAQEDMFISVRALWEDIPDPRFMGHSILLTGEVGVNFYVQLPNGKTAADYPDAYVTFAGNKVNGKPHNLSEARLDEASGRYEFTAYVSSIQMAEKITPTFHYTEGGQEKEITGEPYAAEDYIKWALTDGKPALEAYSPKLYHIAEALADYGHFAQPYLSRYNNWKIGTDYVEMATHVRDGYNYSEVLAASASGAYRLEKGAGPVNSISYRVVFGALLSVDVRLSLKSGKSITEVLVDGKPAKATPSGSYYMVTVPSIYASTLAMEHKIEVKSAEGVSTIYISPMSYVYEMMGKSTSANDLKDMLSALYYFAQACR